LSIVEGVQLAMADLRLKLSLIPFGVFYQFIPKGIIRPFGFKQHKKNRFLFAYVSIYFLLCGIIYEYVLFFT